MFVMHMGISDTVPRAIETVKVASRFNPLALDEIRLGDYGSSFSLKVNPPNVVPVGVLLVC